MSTDQTLQLLLTVEDRFQIEQLGLILAPDFSVPNGAWSDQTDAVTVESSDGKRFTTEALFGLTHFNIRDPEVSIDRRWRVTVTLPSAQRDQVSVGSRVFASPELVASLHKQNQAEQDW